MDWLLRCPRPWLPLLASLAVAAPAAARAAAAPVPPSQTVSAGQVLAWVRANQWDAAGQAAAQWLDPVAAKLVTYYRMMTPGAATMDEIGGFLAENPDWPGQATLARRREQALAADPDDSAVLAACPRMTLHLAVAQLRCAEVARQAGHETEAEAMAVAAWTGPDLVDRAAESRFLAAWGKAMTPADQWHRFERLVWSDPGAASRQLARLDPDHRRLGEVELALQRGDKKAGAMLAALPASLRAEPSLMLDRVRALRRAADDQAALSLWLAEGAAAEQAAPPDRLPLFWAERNVLARQLLADGNAGGAYALVDAHGPLTGEPKLDAAFLAGWIALRRLQDPATAARHFRVLADASQAAITQGRAHYWLGRAAEAAGDHATARAEYVKAATWPTTYYGQLAALAVGDDPAALNARIDALHDPHWTRAQAVAFVGQQVARAAVLLVAWGEPYRARPFLRRLEEEAPGPSGQAMAAWLALGLGLPDQAVAIARRAGVDGLILADVGWPDRIEPPDGPVERAVTLGLIRQESSFNTAAFSPSGARGLMQLMPATAQDVAHHLGLSVSLVSLTADPDENMRLGTSYFETLLQQFGGSLPLAIAAYNAGPNRVQEWLATNGDPRVSGDMIDWIELIPFGETRNYVQRVVENIAVYRAHLGLIRPYPVPPWRP
ncbi:MAG TPA: lytic transglycosylase domain-containing protein [Acetobacteraceae bacterium]|nr:lytic transglycosylase domain-containing protein [Acetobacteraceae bacterium]